MDVRGDFKEIEEPEETQVFTMLCARHVEKLSKNVQIISFRV